MAKFKKKKAKKASKRRSGYGKRRGSKRRGRRGGRRGGSTTRMMVIAGGTAILATLAARANIKALTEEPDADKAKMGWYRKGNLLKPVGVLGTATAAATGVAYFTDLKDAPAVAFGLAIASGVQLANHGGLFDAKETTAQQGLLKVAGVDTALGGDVLDERELITD